MKEITCIYIDLIVYGITLQKLTIQKGASEEEVNKAQKAYGEISS